MDFIERCQTRIFGVYQVRIRVQLDMFEDSEVAVQKSVATLWYDKDTLSFRESNAKKSKKVLHVDSWKNVEPTKQQQ